MPAPVLRNVFILLAIFLSACSENAGEAPERPAPGVAAITLEPREVTFTRSLSGRTSAYLKAEVRPQIGGIVADRLFVEGEHVDEGDLLYQLDDALYRAELDSARANLAQAEATRITASRSAERAEALSKTGSISRQALDDLAAANREAAAAVNAAEATVNASQVRLGFAQITAPISGIISRSNVTRGALVSADQPEALATIHQLDPIFVDFNRAAAEWLALRASIRQGQLNESDSGRVLLTLEDGSDYPHPGRLLFSEVSVNPGTGSFVLRAEFPNPEMTLLPGMFVRGEITLGSRQDALLVPQRALLRDGGGDPYVFLLNNDGTVKRRLISIEQQHADGWLLRDGLREGDRIIISGVQNLRDGMRVDLRSDAGAADKG